MRWKYKPKTSIDKIKKRFALFPVVVEDEWVWLETYYSYTEEGYAGPETERRLTYEAMTTWLKQYEAE